MTDRLQVGLDYVVPQGEVTPRASYRFGEDRGWFGYVGTSSTRTATEDGDQGVFGLVGYGGERWSLYTGTFVPFEARTYAVAGGRYDFGAGYTFEPFYDGQFIHLGVAKAFGPTRVLVARSGTGRLSVSVAFSFDD